MGGGRRPLHTAGRATSRARPRQLERAIQVGSNRRPGRGDRLIDALGRAVDDRHVNARHRPSSSVRAPAPSTLHPPRTVNLAPPRVDCRVSASTRLAAGLASEARAGSHSSTRKQVTIRELLDAPGAPADGRAALELIRLEKAEIGYNKKPLLPPFDLSVRSGERLAVLGPNGGGKSTLLKSLIGLLPLLSGRRAFPMGRMPRAGYVPQAHRADPVYPLTSLQVVLQGRYGLIGLGRFPKAADRRAAFAQLEKVGMSEMANAAFRSLSGGQRQRVLLARALCGEPELLALDEFTSDMDPVASAALLGEVAQLADREKASVIFVTHEISAAALYATEVVMLDARRGVFAAGSSEQLLTAEVLSRLYGQNVSVERRGDRTVVFVETGRPT